MNPDLGRLGVSIGTEVTAVALIERGWGEHIRGCVTLSTGEKLFLKERPDYLTPREFASLRHAVSDMARAGAPIPPDPEAAPPLIWQGGRLYWLESYLGDACAPPAASSEAAIALAQFHLKARRVELWRRRRHRRPALRWLHQSDSPTWLSRRLYLAVEGSADLAAHSSLRQLVALLLDDLELHPGAMPRPSVIHGDAAAENARIDVTTGNVALLDFDDLRWGEPEYDVLQYLIRDLWERPDDCSPGSIEAFIEAYKSIHHVCPRRMRALLPLVSSATAAIEFGLLPQAQSTGSDWERAVDMARTVRDSLRDVI